MDTKDLPQAKSISGAFAAAALLGSMANMVGVGAPSGNERRRSHSGGISGKQWRANQIAKAKRQAQKRARKATRQYAK